MNIKQRAIIAVLVISGFIFFQLNKNSQKNSLTKDDLQVIIDTVEQSFEKAEKTILNNQPIVPDTPSGPNPDPDKCICKGTGKIVQGDGHVSPCPYHAKNEPEPKPNTDICKCGCNKSGCSCQCGLTTKRRGLFGIFR